MNFFNLSPISVAKAGRVLTSLTFSTAYNGVIGAYTTLTEGMSETVARIESLSNSTVVIDRRNGYSSARTVGCYVLCIGY